MLPAKALVKISLNTILGLVLIYAWSRFVDIKEILEKLKETDVKVIPLFYLVFFLATVVRALRFRILLNNYKIAFKDLVFLNFLSQFLSFTIPIRAGEIAKSIYLSTGYGLPLSKSLVWVLVDRFLDLWAMLFVTSMLLLAVKTRLPAAVTGLFGVVFLTCTLCLVFALKGGWVARKVAGWFAKLLVFQKLQDAFLHFADAVIDGLQILHKKPKDLGVIFTLSVLATVVDAMSWYFIFLSLKIDFPLALTWLGSNLSSMTYLIPAAPGYIGSAEVSGLAVFGFVLRIDNALASSAVVLYHLLASVAILVSGVLSVYILDFNLRKVWKKLRG